MKTVLTLLALFLFTFTSFAQQGTLAGKVKDKKTGEPVIGAVVFITGSIKGASTDVDGAYSIPLDAGVYKITASYVSYKPQTFESIQIDAGKTTTLDINIEEATTELGSVTITGTRQTNTDISLIKELKQSEVVVSGVSGEQIAKSLDRDAAETVRRIPGVTIMNDKYIVIRGMAERYNTVMLNDAFTPSTETDVKSFSFDLLPTSVIDRIMIFKSGSPELPGDFGGGVIKVHTKSVATENRTVIGLSTSYRGSTTFNNFYAYPGSKTDFLGFDNGQRQLPGAFPQDLNTVRGGDELTKIGRSLPNSWAGDRSKTLPDMRFSLGISRLFDLNDVQLSNITAISYSNTRLAIRNATRTKYDELNKQTQSSPKSYDYIDDTYNEGSRIGVIHNWTARFNNRHKLEFRNLFNQSGVSQILYRSGLENFNNLEQRNYALRYESRSLYSGQLQGTHDVNPKTTVTWTGGYAYTNRNEPDYRRVRSQRDIGSTGPFVAAYKFTPSLADAGRFYSNLNENAVSANGQVEHRFNPADSLSENAPKIRAGFYAERKSRDFNARFFSYRPANPGTFDNSILTLPLDQVFAPRNINPETGWEVVEGTNPTDKYVAHNTYLAGFVGGNLPLSANLSASGGVRVEHNIQELALTENSTPLVDKPITRVLPSLNLNYNFNQRSLLRFGSSVSLNRPEFRELAPFSYFDFENLWEIRGNPTLKTASIYNTDLRYEFYPNATELISFGVFGKYLVNSIERYFEETNIGNAVSFRNADKAFNMGVETEIRKSLLDLSASKFIQNLTLVVNASFIKSQVKTTEDAAAGLVEKRPLTGQSPYIVNTGIYYQDDAKKLQVNLLYNVIGQRILVVGGRQNQTVYDMPRHVIDLSLTKGIGERFELKAGIQDLLNQKTRWIQDSNRDSKITGADDPVQVLRRGTYSTIGISYKL